VLKSDLARVRAEIWPWIKQHGAELVELRATMTAAAPSGGGAVQTQQLYQSRFEGVYALTDFFSRQSSEKYGNELEAGSLLWTRQGDRLKQLSLATHAPTDEPLTVEIVYADPARTFVKSFEPKIEITVISTTEVQVLDLDYELPPGLQLLARFTTANVNEGYYGSIEVQRAVS